MRECREHDGAKTTTGGRDDSACVHPAAGPAKVVCIDQMQRMVQDHTRHGHEADDRRYREFVSQQELPHTAPIKLKGMTERTRIGAVLAHAFGGEPIKSGRGERI
jgi:hypothetical protein